MGNSYSKNHKLNFNVTNKVISIFLEIIFPIMIFGSYLFYLFWSSPVKLLLQGYSINYLFLKTHNLVLYSIAICIFLVFLLVLAYYKKWKKAIVIITGILLVIPLISILYVFVFPYNYGTVLDNSTLTPNKSLINFGIWYYLLDVIIITTAICIISWAFRYKHTIPLMTMLFLFFSIENVSVLNKAIQSKNITKNHSNTNVQNVQKITLSKTKPNVLFFIYDGFGKSTTRYFLTNNSIEDKYKWWSKDFILYNNTQCLFGSSLGSIPTLYGGYKFAVQYQFDDIFLKHKFPSIMLGCMLYSHVAREELKQEIAQYADSIDLTPPFYGDYYVSENIPVITASIYKHIPYSLRFITASDYRWKIPNKTLWLFSKGGQSKPEHYTINVSDNVDKGTLMLFYSDYSHVPWVSTNAPIALDEAKDLKDLETILYYNVKDILIEITSLIDQLKQQGVYDNTKIIIASDHGTHAYIRGDLMKPFFNHIGAIPCGALLMVKDINFSGMKLQEDNRFLSLGDIRGIIENTFGKTNLVDYTKTMPPKRVFNIPEFPIRALEGMHYPNFLEGVAALKQLVKENKISYVQISNKNPYKGTEFHNYPLSNVAELPIVEEIE